MKLLKILCIWLGLAIPVGATELTGDASGAFPKADIYLLGEVHDNPQHHLNQADAIRALRPAAIVFEMLTPDQADVVNRFNSPFLTAPPIEDWEHALGWADSGWPDFELYAPVFKNTRGARVYGAVVPRDDLMAAISDGAAAVWGPGAEAAGLDPLPEDQQAAREALQMAAHCDALPEEMLGGMVAAQRLRDARFAAVTVEALEKTGGPVVVITGNGHARKDWGIPVYLAAQAPEARVISLAQFETRADPDPPYDFWLITEAAERDDPCGVFENRDG